MHVYKEWITDGIRSKWQAYTYKSIVFAQGSLSVCLYAARLSVFLPVALPCSHPAISLALPHLINQLLTIRPPPPVGFFPHIITIIPCKQSINSLLSFHILSLCSAFGSLLLLVAYSLIKYFQFDLKVRILHCLHPCLIACSRLQCLCWHTGVYLSVLPTSRSME